MVEGLVPLRVLVVDDEDVVLDFFKRLLKEESYDISAAKTGKEALEQVKAKEHKRSLL
jgi:CheY-like chemotaxis protein